MKRLLWILSILVICGIGLYFYLSTQDLKPSFVEISDLKVLESNSEKMLVSGNIILFNPSRQKAQLINTELRVISNDLTVARISQTSASSIDAKSNFKLPVSCNIDFTQLRLSHGISEWIEKALNKDRSIPLKFDGYCNVKYNNETYRIPITHEEEIRF